VRSTTRDVQPLFDAADLHPEVEAGRLGDRERHAGARALETLEVHGHHIVADGHARDDVVARFVGDAGVGDIGRLVRRGDRHMGYGTARAVLDDSGQRRQTSLPGCGPRHSKGDRTVRSSLRGTVDSRIERSS
jgi:hypothetical protein